MRTMTFDPSATHLKLAILDDETLRCSYTFTHWQGRPRQFDIEQALLRYDPVDIIAIRFAHGGSRAGATWLGEAEIDDLERFCDRAPSHQPRSVRLARMMRAEGPNDLLVGCYDTAFHRTMPPHATVQALPEPWNGREEYRRIGFNGLSHRYATDQAAAVLGRPVQDLEMIVVHAGDSVSVSAVSGGRSVDTSMGYSPGEGPVMATRSGSLDPGVVLDMVRDSGGDLDAVAVGLRRRAGLSALTGGEPDMRKVLVARADGDARAAEAIEVYLHRLRREIGAASVSLSRVDALVLTGDVMSRFPVLRSELVGGLQTLGLRVERLRNVVEGAADRVIGTTPGGPAVVVVPPREELQLAREARLLLAAESAA